MSPQFILGSKTDVYPNPYPWTEKGATSATSCLSVRTDNNIYGYKPLPFNDSQ